jgi:hypothetical protein
MDRVFLRAVLNPQKSSKRYLPQGRAEDKDSPVNGTSAPVSRLPDGLAVVGLVVEHGSRPLVCDLWEGFWRSIDLSSFAEDGCDTCRGGDLRPRCRPGRVTVRRHQGIGRLAPSALNGAEAAE